MELDELRDKIDSIDTKLVHLFEARMETVAQIAAYKKAEGVPMRDLARETEILKAATDKVDPILAPYTHKLFETLLALSRSYQEVL